MASSHKTLIADTIIERLFGSSLHYHGVVDKVSEFAGCRQGVRSVDPVQRLRAHSARIQNTRSSPYRIIVLSWTNPRQWEDLQ
jgi:hypothetical protein